MPFPVELPAEVSAVIPAKGETNVRIEFLSAHMSDLLEKLVFRHHRRLVAEARQAR